MLILILIVAVIIVAAILCGQKKAGGPDRNEPSPPPQQGTIRCPHCGSPARVRGSRWECGWCGDFGDIITK